LHLLAAVVLGGVPSRGPMVEKSLGGSGIGSLFQREYLVADPERG